MSIALPTRLRLALMVAAGLCLLVLIAWAARTSWHDFAELDQGIDEAERGSFRIAEGFRGALHEVNLTLLRFGTGEADVQRERFEEQSGRLNEWLDEQKNIITTQREREVIEQIERAYDDYLAAAARVIKVARETDDLQLVFKALDEAGLVSLRLSELGNDLAAANSEARRQWREEVRVSLDHLQFIIFGSLVCVLGVGVATGVFVFRRLIAPLQHQLEESRALIERQEKLASLGVLAAGVAHEIRNPLTAIKVRLFTLREELASSGLGAEDTGVIAAEIDRLERIVKDFLHFARPSEPKLESILPTRIFGGVRDLLAMALEKRGIALVLEVVADAPVCIDPEQIRQVLINLVRNAADAIGGAGKITLRARAGMGGLDGRRRRCVFLEIEDTGAGIPPEARKRLFDPFFSTKETGTGLGLPIAARIVERHGGVLDFETRTKGGTTFRVILPRPDE